LKVLWKRKVYLCVIVCQLTGNRFGRKMEAHW
jgi:hypothetical protein